MISIRTLVHVYAAKTKAIAHSIVIIVVDIQLVGISYISHNLFKAIVAD